MARYRKRELAYWGVDLVKAKINLPESCPLHGLSENSNQIFIEFAGRNLSVTLEDNSVFRRYVVIRVDMISIGFVAYNAREKQKYDRFEVTGQALTIFGVDIFYFLFSRLGLEFVEFKRFDVCFDMFLNTTYFFETLLDEKTKKSGAGKFSIERSKAHGVETIYIGQRDPKKNPYKLERIYNKVLDTRKKGKQFLYDDLYKDENGKYRDVTRFEVECRSDLAKFWHFEDLKNDKLLFYRLVKSFYPRNVQFFKFLKDSDFFEFSRSYNDRRKNALKAILSGKKSASPMNKAQERLKKAVERRQHLEQWGNDFLSEFDKKQCAGAFRASVKRLFGNGFSREKLHRMLDIYLNSELKPEFIPENFEKSSKETLPPTSESPSPHKLGEG